MALKNPVSRTNAKKYTIGCMAKILIAGVLFFAVFLLMSCRSTSYSDKIGSIHGGYELKTMEDDPSAGKIEHKGALFGSNSYWRKSRESKIFNFFNYDAGIITENEDTFSLHNWNFDLLAGFAYMFDYKPVKIMLGGGFYLGYYYVFEIKKGAVFLDISHTTAGLGIMTDVQYWMTDHFFIDLYGSYNLGLLGGGGYTIRYPQSNIQYEYDMKLKTPTYMNVKLGLGWKWK